MRARTPSRVMSPLTTWRQYKVKPSKMVLESPNYISNEYRCGDCGQSDDYLDESSQIYMEMACVMWSALILIGVSVGAVGAVQTILIEELLIVKYNILSQWLAVLQTHFAAAHIYWAVVSLVPIAICAALIVYFEPCARGLGIPRIMGYLNCIDIPGFVSFKTALVKNFSIILASSAGLPGGREEPFIHMGAVMGGSLSSIEVRGWQPFGAYGDAAGRRDLVTAGTVAAVAVSFGTPLGAVLFCLEEGITFWNARLTYIMFLCSVIATYMLHLMRTLILDGTHFSTKIQHYMFFSDIEEMQLNYKFSDIPIFILFGIIGALIGSFWNISFAALHNVRKRYFAKKYWEFIGAVIFGLIYFMFVVSFFHLTHDFCTQREEKSNRIKSSKEMKVYCERDKFESIGVFFFLDSRYTMNYLLTMPENGTMRHEILFIGMMGHLIFSVLQSETVLPSGILVPHLIAGATWGHILSSWILPHESLGEWTVQAKYTFLGAFAQACGITRFTLSLGVIMVESSGQATFAIPVFIIALTAKWFGSLMTEPIFRTVAYLNGYPLIRTSLLPISSSFNAPAVMSSPLISLPMKIELSDLLVVLQRNDHQNYPIVANKKVVGVVLQKHILAIFFTKKFQAPKSEKEIRALKKSLKYHSSHSLKEINEIIKDGKYVLQENEELNLEHIMNQYPYIIHENMSLRRIYTLFLSLGAAYVIVVDDIGNGVGIITRKDVARFRKLEQFLLLRTEIVPII